MDWMVKEVAGTHTPVALTERRKPYSKHVSIENDTHKSGRSEVMFIYSGIIV